MASAEKPREIVFSTPDETPHEKKCLSARHALHTARIATKPRPLLILGRFLSNSFPDFPLFFQEKQEKQEKQEIFPKFGNLTEGKICGTSDKIIGKYRTTKNRVKTKKKET